MNAASGGQSDASLDAFLDDRLDAGQRAAFADRLASDSALAAEVEAQRRINHALGRLFTTPPSAGVPAEDVTADVRPFPKYDGMALQPRGPANVYVNQTRGVIWGSLIGAALFCLTWLLYSQLLSPSYSFDTLSPTPPSSEVDTPVSSSTRFV